MAVFYGQYVCVIIEGTVPLLGKTKGFQVRLQSEQPYRIPFLDH